MISGFIRNHQAVIVGRFQRHGVRVSVITLIEIKIKSHFRRAFSAEIEQRVGSLDPAVLRQILIHNFAQETERSDQIRFPRAVSTNEHIQPTQQKRLLSDGLEVLDRQFPERAHLYEN